MSKSKHGWPATLEGLDRHDTVHVITGYRGEDEVGHEAPFDRWQADYSEGPDFAPPEAGDRHVMFRGDPESWDVVVGEEETGRRDKMADDIPTKRDAIAWAREALRSFRD